MFGSDQFARKLPAWVQAERSHKDVVRKQKNRTDRELLSKIKFGKEAVSGGSVPQGDSVERESLRSFFESDLDEVVDPMQHKDYRKNRFYKEHDTHEKSEFEARIKDLKVNLKGRHLI